MKILFTTDGSMTAQTAMETACHLFDPKQVDQCDLLFVTPAITSPMTGWSSDERMAARYRKRAELYGHKVLREARARLSCSRSGAKVHGFIEFGSPGRIIVEKSAGYDVVVAGGSRAGVAGLGPVANRIAESAFGTVLIGRPLRDSSSGGLRVLIPVDGSEASKDAIDVLVDKVKLEGAELKVLHVMENPWLHPGIEEEFRDESGEPEDLPDPELHKMMLRAGERIVEAARMRIPEGLHCATSASVVHGLPANEILTEAEQGEFDLIVMGVSMGADLKHAMLGSVSSKVTWNASCSVLLVKPA
jgi:nucleotide-binding universal stress UspA family protein